MGRMIFFVLRKLIRGIDVLGSASSLFISVFCVLLKYKLRIFVYRTSIDRVFSRDLNLKNRFIKLQIFSLQSIMYVVLICIKLLLINYYFTDNLTRSTKQFHFV